MANTVQIKRGNNTSVNAHTGPSGELIYNLDTGRLHAQDGSTAGGNPHALISDVDLKANASVTVSAGAGLTGGGTLEANRTLALSSASIASLSLADSAVQSVNGKTGSSITLTKADVGLSNVDNTSDASKPISTATQTALNAKASSSVTVSAGTGLTGGGNLTANRSIALNAASIASLGKADTALQAPGGTTGQVLAKNSAADNDVAWISSEAATAVSYAPQTLTEPQKTQARTNIGAASAAQGTKADSAVSFEAQSLTAEEKAQARENVGLTTSTIEHIRDGTFIYDVIRVSNRFSVSKQFAPGAAPDGVVDKISARSFAEGSGHKISINADGWRNADGSPGWDKTSARPVGLQISDNILYQDWQAGEQWEEAVVMMPDGYLTKARIDDGMSGADWVSAGALWSVCWGFMCVENGAAINLDSTYVGAQGKSARTILGQKSSGELIIVLIEGKSGEYGATGSEAGILARSLGCDIAYICDGGGSSQAWWKNAYAVPSSDVDGDFPAERGVPTFLVVDQERDIPEYDSGYIKAPLLAGFTPMGSRLGYGLTVRQKGPYIFCSMRISGSFPSSSETAITGQNSIPMRYFITDTGLSRIWASGNGGRAASMYISDTRVATAANHHTTNYTYVVGSGFWPSVFTDVGA